MVKKGRPLFPFFCAEAFSSFVHPRFTHVKPRTERFETLLLTEKYCWLHKETLCSSGHHPHMHMKIPSVQYKFFLHNIEVEKLVHYCA